MLAEVTGFDLERREVVLDHLPNGERRAVLGYDTLIVAGGSRYSYFGHDEWQDARARAEVARRRARRSATASWPRSRRPRSSATPTNGDGWLTFVVVGAGPTGRRDGRADRRARPRRAAPRLPLDRPARRARSARRSCRPRPHRASRSRCRGRRRARSSSSASLRWSGTPSSTSARPRSRSAPRTARSSTSVRARSIWAAGVTASALAAKLASAAGARRRPGGTAHGAARSHACPDIRRCSRSATWCRCRPLMARSRRCPVVAPVAMQQGRYAARVIRERLARSGAGPFRYVDKGNLATIGRSKAVADVKGIHVAGFVAWVALARRPPLLPDRIPEPAARRSSAGRSASSPADEEPG